MGVLIFKDDNGNEKWKIGIKNETILKKEYLKNYQISKNG